MPKSKRSPALIKAQENYNKKRITKIIKFNTDTESDLVEALKHIPNFNGFVKSKLKEFLEELNS